MAKKLLILDDNLDVLEALKEFFEADNLELLLENDSEAAIERVKKEHPHVALIDITLPKKSGLDVLREIKEIDPRICVIIMTGNLTTQNAIEAMKHGAYDYLTKPLNLNQLENIISKAFQCSMLTRGIRIIAGDSPVKSDESETDVMIGSSPEMIEIWKMIGKIAESDATVLIQGDSGTGKELLARSIYNNSKRNNKPFLAVNCAALPENLLESELFGHEKGAFTDAVRRHIGRFEQCNGGTIFLDEIAEMSLKNQAKMLRVLENQEFERVGGTEVIKIDVRIITATNRSLINAVKEKRFRMDLFYRLKVVSIFLPPLRERLEDIPVLANHFIKKYCKENRKAEMKVSPAAMKFLISYPWAGNIRELKNVMNSAVVFSKVDTLFPDDLEPLLYGRNIREEVTSGNATSDYYATLKPLFEAMCLNNEERFFDSFIAEVEQAIFTLTMEKYNNNEVQAANFLSISRNTLRQRLKKFNL
jgi:DNA-binding NtrC family response regulator